MIVVLPERLFGVDPITVGHLINAASAAASIALVGYLGWRVRPLIGAIAAVIFAANPYTLAIARTAGIDLPSIALTFAYIVLGLVVMRRRSLGLAFVLGAVFAIAFLIKETILPFAPVPFLVGVLWGVPWRTIFRTAAATLGVAAVGTSWWFVLYASYTHTVYRADFPEWTLLPIAIATLILVVLGLAADRIAEWVGRHGWEARTSSRIPEQVRADSRVIAGWGGTAAWFIFLFVFFSRTPKLLGYGLLNSEQIRFFIGHLDGSMRLAFAFGVGSLLLVLELLRDRSRVAPASIDLLVATTCGIPLILLV